VEIEVEDRQTILDLPPEAVELVPEPDPVPPWQDPQYRCWGSYEMSSTMTDQPEDFATWEYAFEDEIGYWLSEYFDLKEKHWVAAIHMLVLTDPVEGTGRTRWHARRAAERRFRERVCEFNILGFRLGHQVSKPTRNAVRS
jgi:hypothetical protein